MQARWLCLLAIFGFGIAIHFWGLSRFNGLVFDEVFFPKYAQNYIDGAQFFDAHPPFGKYLIAMGMQLSDVVGNLGAQINNGTGSWHPAWGYRWVDALVGSLLPMVFAGIAWQLSRRWKVVLLTALLTSLDGLFLVESRYGLINIFMLFFGLLGHYLYLASLGARQSGKGRHTQMALLVGAGLAFGACISVKWSGMAFLAVPWGMWLVAHLQAWWQARRTHTTGTIHRTGDAVRHPLQEAVHLGLPIMLAALLALPALFYVVQMQPHLRINKIGFIELNRQMLAYHRGVKDGPSEHPYCSRWSTWPLMERPVSYLFTTRNPDDTKPMSPVDVAPPPSSPTHVVHAMGNPPLWWLVVPATLLAMAVAMRGAFGAAIGVASARGRQLRGRIRARPVSRRLAPLGNQEWTALYLAAGYTVSLVPWIGITRCAFIYHYMPSLSFGFLACALMIDRMTSARGGWRALGYAAVLLIVAGFIYWLPLYLGLPTSLDDWHSRMWFQSWI